MRSQGIFSLFLKAAGGSDETEYRDFSARSNALIYFGHKLESQPSLKKKKI